DDPAAPRDSDHLPLVPRLVSSHWTAMQPRNLRRAMAGLPSAVRIREVGPRDGFQNEPEVIQTGEKVRLIELLGATGLRRIEVTSFVRPDIIPQLADASEVLSAVSLAPDVAVSVLIPNERGLERALPLRDR